MGEGINGAILSIISCVIVTMAKIMQVYRGEHFWTLMVLLWCECNESIKPVVSDKFLPGSAEM